MSNEEKKSGENKSGLPKFSLSKAWKNLLGEYKRIVWLEPKDLLKQTYTVIATCVFFGFIIFLMDLAYGFCTDYAINFLSK